MSETASETRHAWEKHPNFGGPASTLLGIHDQFRIASRRMAQMAEREPAVDRRWMARAFEPLATTLHHHHHAEEVMLFPLVLVRTGVAPAELVDDHGTLMAAITAVEESFSAEASSPKAALARFDEILVAHLAREEALVVPVLLEIDPHEAWAMIHGDQ